MVDGSGDAGSVSDLVAVVRSSGWMMDVLRAARAVSLPQWWVGGGVLRDLVWDTRAGGFDPLRVKDVDLAFFDPTDLSHVHDERAQAALVDALSAVTWDAKNQAAVHTWYAARFGFEVAPLASATDGVATWPETATAVAVRLDDHDEVEVTGVQGGVDDLMAGVHRRNPRRVSDAEYRRRLARRNVAERWPQVRVIP